MKSIIFAIAFILLLFLSIGGIKFFQISSMLHAFASMQQPPTAVATSKVSVQQWETILPSVGELEAVQGVVVAADIPGRATKIEFTPGTYVTAGTPLVRQDITQEDAQLRAAEASITLAKNNLNRSKELLKKNVISQSQFEVSDANYKSAVAQADNVRAIIEKKTIRAPFDGRLGIRMINLGSDLNSGTPIVTLQTLSPIFVNFYLPQQNLSEFDVNHLVRITTDAVPNTTYNGTITAISPEVDRRTRSIRIQATIENEQGQLLPGMFAKVKVVAPKTISVMAIPQTAVAYATFGDSVFVVTKEKNEAGTEILKATQQFVKLGRTFGDFVEVQAGLNEGDEIVSAGVFKLRNGAAITINNESNPEYKTNPTPEDT